MSCDLDSRAYTGNRKIKKRSGVVLHRNAPFKIKSRDVEYIGFDLASRPDMSALVCVETQRSQIIHPFAMPALLDQPANSIKEADPESILTGSSAPTVAGAFDSGPASRCYGSTGLFDDQPADSVEPRSAKPTPSGVI